MFDEPLIDQAKDLEHGGKLFDEIYTFLHTTKSYAMSHPLDAGIVFGLMGLALLTKGRSFFPSLTVLEDSSLDGEVALVFNSERPIQKVAEANTNDCGILSSGVARAPRSETYNSATVELVRHLEMTQFKPTISPPLDFVSIQPRQQILELQRNAGLNYDFSPLLEGKPLPAPFTDSTGYAFRSYDHYKNYLDFLNKK